MKFYQITSVDADGRDFIEFTSSKKEASSARVRLKKLEHTDIETKEVDIVPARSGIIDFMNSNFAHPSYITPAVADALD